MILPMSQEELEHATDEEILRAHARLGVPRESAEAYLAIIRKPDPNLIVD